MAKSRLVLLLLCVSFSVCQECIWSSKDAIPFTFDLSSSNCTKWKLSNQNGTISVFAQVPGEIHGILQQNKIIGDPYFEKNEDLQRWIGAEDWIFEATFVLPDLSQLKDSVAEIVFSSIDTISIIELNGKVLGKTNNAFRPWKFLVSLSNSNPHLVSFPRVNTLRVQINSPVKYAEIFAKSYPYAVPYSLYKNGLHYANFLRKTQSDFGWDWGPAFSPGGLLGPISIKVRKLNDGISTHLLSSHIHSQKHKCENQDTFSGCPYPKHVELNLSAVLSVIHQCESDASCCEPFDRELGTISFHLSHLELSKQHQIISETFVNIRKSMSQVEWREIHQDNFDTLRQWKRYHVTVYAKLVVPEDEVYLWWPRLSNVGGIIDLKKSSFGTWKPYLYNLTVELQNGVEIQRWNGKVGLRSVELVRDPIPSEKPNPHAGTTPGETFYLRINGLSLSVKGANVIPFDTFRSRVSVDKIRHFIESSIKANMNMLRIWGGGQYAPSSFYEICDENGILVWQEAMFACSLYPRDKNFLANVYEEVTFQAERLGHHASVILWGGNNEIEQAMDWYPESIQYRYSFVTDYAELFLNTIRQAVRKVSQDGIFLDSSPSNGIVSFEPYFKRWGNANDGSYGDIHYYNYEADCEKISTYPAARFVSEWGFQGLPSFVAFKDAVGDQDKHLGILSEFNEYRQRHIGGNQKILRQISNHFSFHSSLPNATGPSAYRLQSYLSQLQQSRCYYTAISRWRNAQDVGGRSLGFLYWQLNDIWQGPSWSSIEFDGLWKLLHHKLASAFEMIHLTSVITSKDNSEDAHTNQESCTYHTHNLNNDDLDQVLSCMKVHTSQQSLQLFIHSDIPLFDKQNSVIGQVSIDVLDFYQGTVLEIHEFQFEISSLSSKLVADLVLKQLLRPCIEQEKLCFFRVSVDVQEKLQIASISIDIPKPKQQMVIPVSFTALPALIDPGLMLTVLEIQCRNEEGKLGGCQTAQPVSRVKIEIRASKAVAFHVQISSTKCKGVFSDNGIDFISPEEPIVLFFSALDFSIANCYVQDVIEDFKALSLADANNPPTI